MCQGDNPEAFRRSNTQAFQDTVRTGRELASNYWNKVHDSRTSVSEYKGKPEPSATIDISGKRMSGDAAAAAIGKRFHQESVLRFRPSVMGRRPEYTLTGLKDPVAALEVLKKHGLPGARIDGRNLVFVDLDGNLGGNVKSAAKELGVPVNKQRGRGELIEASDYNRLMQIYEDQRNVINKGPAINPLYLASVASSYGAQPQSERKTRGGKVGNVGRHKR